MCCFYDNRDGQTQLSFEAIWWQGILHVDAGLFKCWMRPRILELGVQPHYFELALRFQIRWLPLHWSLGSQGMLWLPNLWADQLHMWLWVFPALVPGSLEALAVLRKVVLFNRIFGSPHWILIQVQCRSKGRPWNKQLQWSWLAKDDHSNEKHWR